jgi:hypothetical protein
MRLEFTTQSSAQSFADRLHSWMISNYPWYSESVSKGQTTAFAIPYQDRDIDGNILSASWYVNLKERALGGLSQEEKQGIK